MLKKLGCKQIFAGVCLGAIATQQPLLAQTYPESQIEATLNSPHDEISQLLPPEFPAPNPHLSSPSPPSQPPIPTPGALVPVRRIEVVGSTILSDAEIQAIAQSYEGRSVSFEELQLLADKLTQAYLDRGYLTSRAILSTQTVTDGIVRVQILEGSLEDIKIEGNDRVRPEYIRSRILLGVTEPLQVDKLEDRLQLLRLDPLFKTVESSLQPGTEEGKSILAVRVEEASPFILGVNFDNYSPPSIGGEEFKGLIGYRNLTGWGDEWTGSYRRSLSGGLQAFDFNFRMPLNPTNGTIQLRFAPSHSKITEDDFKALEIKANNQLYEIAYRQPLIETFDREFALSLGFSVQNGQTFLFNNIPFGFGIGPDSEGNSRTRVLQFAQDYIKRDSSGAWALRSQFNLGLGIFDATKNESPIPDGRFFSWLGQVQRVQRLSPTNRLLMQAELQLTPDSLLPSQQFAIGGGQSLRGFRQNTRSGDNGFRISVEDRIAIFQDESGFPIFQVAPFIDFGKVWNHSDNPNVLPRQNFLAGGGIGLIWQPFSNLLIRLDGATPLIELDDRGNNIQDKALYFNVSYQL
ncbi:ShlB/FhaC/HecB family hemolysin secretion/activation protein [Oscillatoria sp. FACHB-1406]|uniref:ShlB/FhaC/HecB family hemolysin secretion/activation protein n=1 Tax=Oscillatoria sp. FACHB-1406 TaxID=2692846 RepID=UPI0016865321|nr:ShlB/FhaC/HecB family hemolysin secretion/activation protein [Oscillatoria sp. FACHB-1406]MBD2578661.1 ShlB/FhaC/HecB family hemolysin secretion/activation protein [Oscillatoria sp. FACHB-1406]